MSDFHASLDRALAQQPLLATRDALVRVLAEHEDFSSGLSAIIGCICGESMPSDAAHRIHQADALLGSGILQTPAEWAAGLADDEALVKRVTSEFCKPALNEAMYSDFTRDYLRALAAALAEQEGGR